MVFKENAWMYYVMKFNIIYPGHPKQALRPLVSIVQCYS